MDRVNDQDGATSDSGTYDAKVMGFPGITVEFSEAVTRDVKPRKKGKWIGWIVALLICGVALMVTEWITVAMIAFN